ncbi:MAG: hypothetical protein KAI66_16675, partial [Lentisphaeria bacterium]|nr:hypothetical protein [Lentisphaeria bacterium]
KATCSLDRRFFPVTQMLKRKLVPEQVNHFHFSYNKGYFGWGAPTNLFTADAIHLLDLILFLGGPVDEVHAYASRRDGKQLRSFSGALKLERGGFATFDCHYSMPAGRHGRRQLFEVTSDGLSAYLDLGPCMAESRYGGTGVIIDGEEEMPVEQYFQEKEEQPAPESSSELLNFASWIRGESEPDASLEDIIESVRVTEAIASGYHGKMADFRPVFDRTNAP